MFILINVAMLIFATFWYKKDKEYEPVIVILGQVLGLLGLFFEDTVSKIFTKDIYNSELNIKKQLGDSIHTENVQDSKIDIS